MGIDIKQHLTPPMLLVIFLVIVSLMIVFPVLNMIILGAILAYGIKPVAHKIQSKLKFSSISILLAMVVVLIPLILLIAYIVTELIAILSGASSTSTYADINSLLSSISAYLPWSFDVNSISTSINTSVQEIGRYVLNYLAKFVSSLMNITLDLFILVCSVFYFVRDGNNFIQFIRSFVPDDSKAFFDNTIESVKDVLRSIFYGHFLTSVIIGILGAIGYSILGYPFGIFLGVITGILQLIPVFGPWPIYWGLFFMDLLSGNYPRAITVLLFGFFLSTIDMYIRPALSSHYADIHPLILLVGFLSGPLVYGIVGFIVGPLILGITYAVLDNYRKEYILGDE
ncbi:MAG: AI-2E family transporter [Methanobrevibacter thaueri]|jgi:predicted PurR-regulated permease PerM|uniref:AI-2E family transporter n=1 Tax=Methanobrevibacter thaueri TaxID=190975 RepID=A0A8T3V5I4_9EURY|nr:AI-2E family transporter [Methanobrevibacter thaueri]MBE6501832.1 AI-2E family transporter [Methanobrevibacter thaueri]